MEIEKVRPLPQLPLRVDTGCLGAKEMGKSVQVARRKFEGFSLLCKPVETKCSCTCFCTIHKQVRRR